MCVHTSIQKEENIYKTCTHTLSDYYDYLSMLGKVEWKIMSDLFCIQLWRMRSAAANKGRFGSCGALARVQSSFTSYWMAPAVQSLKRILKALKDSCPAPLPHLPGWEGMRGVNCKLMLYSGFFPCPLSIFLEKYNIFSIIQREEVLRGTDSRYGVTQISPMQGGCYCRFGLGSIGKMLPEACQRQVLQLGFAIHLLSKLHGSIVILLHLREKLKRFFLTMFVIKLARPEEREGALQCYTFQGRKVSCLWKNSSAI